MNLNLFDFCVILILLIAVTIGYKKGAINIIFSFITIGIGLNFFIQDSLLGSMVSDVKIYNKAIISTITIGILTTLHHFILKAIKINYSIHILNKNIGAIISLCQTILILIILYFKLYPIYYKDLTIIKGSLSQKFANKVIKSKTFKDLMVDLHLIENKNKKILK